MGKQFQKRMKDIGAVIEHESKSYVFCADGDDETCINVHGTMVELLALTHALAMAIREEVAKVFPKHVTDRVMNTIGMADEDIKEFLSESIPEWMRKLMGLDEDDDAEDESEDCDDDTEDEADDPEEKAHLEALDKFLKALRNSGGVGFDISGSAHANWGDDER